jgi:glyoxylate utilization-related uncharacterized protein
LELLAYWQPAAGLQESVVHTLPSSQLIGVPAQTPPEQTSLPVHAFPSLHATALFVCVHPVAGLQASVVQMLPSSQLGGGPPVHVPPTQVSLVVQALPSLQELLLLVNLQPETGSHESVVQTFPSLQTKAGPPTHAPAEQASPVVQAFPSVQALLLFVNTHPVAGLHASVVQTLPSLQVSAGPATHAPPEQVSPVVQAFPSLQGLLLFVNTQPVVGLHASVVQGLLSLHVIGVCVQPPA